MRALTIIPATTALLLLDPAPASAQVLPNGNIASPLYPQPGSGSLYPTPMPPQTGMRGGHGGHGHGFGGGAFIIYQEPQVVHDVVVVHDAPAPQPAPVEPPPPPRERYVLGKTYGSLPGGCMKMVEGGGIYFLCSGDWYREVAGRQYKAVKSPI